MDYLIIVSPGENWQHGVLVSGAPDEYAAVEAMWTARGYNSGESIRVRPAVEVENFSAKYVVQYDAAKVEAAREKVRYND